MQRDPAADLAADSRLALGHFVLDLTRGELLDERGRPAELRAQALRVLLVLGERPGQVVGKDEMLRRVWGDVVVTEDSLVQAIGDIRRVLGAAGHGLLRTVPRRGYLLNPAPADESATARDEERQRAGSAIPGGLQPAVASATASAAMPAAGRATPGRRVWIAAGVAVVAALLVLAATLLPRAPPTSIRSFAILPFESDGPSAADAWFADAITADLNTMVARWRAGIHVIGRGTMQAYKGKNADPRTVGRELSVAHVLTGRVRRDGERVRIAVELVDTASARVLWAQPFEVERGELPGLVGDIAGGIAKALFIEIGDVVTRELQPLDPAQADADDLAMRGFSVLLKSVGPESFEQARLLFEQALVRDPSSLRALGGVSLTNSMDVAFSYTDDKDGSMRRSRQALERLESIDPTGHLTLVSRASYRLSSSDWAGQFAVGEELIRHFPNDPTSYHHRCSSLLRLGRFDEAIPACDRAIRISPQESRTPIWRGLAGMNEFMRGNYAAAAERARIPATANPKLFFYPLLLAAALAHDGRRDEARQVIAEFRQRNPGFDGQRATAAWSSLNADPKFVEGRDRIVATVRELGLR